MSQAPPPPPPPPPSPQPPAEPPGPRGPRAAYGALGNRGQIVFWVVASVLGLMFISLIAAAAGSSEQETVTVAEVRTQTEQEVVTVTQTRTVRAPAARTPAAPAPTPQPPAAAARTFEGNGSRNIGNLTLAEDATLRWTNNGDLIQIFVDEPFNVLLNSQGPSGETFVAAGTYNGITVNAIGDWTLSFE